LNVDPIRIVTEYLETSGTALYTLVGAEVYRDRMPSGFLNTAAMVCVQNQALTNPVAQADVQEDRYAIKCYGGTQEASPAWAVFRALVTRLHNISTDTTAGGIVLAELEVASLAWEPEGWPVVIATFRIKTHG